MGKILFQNRNFELGELSFELTVSDQIFRSIMNLHLWRKCVTCQLNGKADILIKVSAPLNTEKRCVEANANEQPLSGYEMKLELQCEMQSKDQMILINIMIQLKYLISTADPTYIMTL